VRRVGILPTLVTAANGFCGLLAIYKTQDGKYDAAAIMILLAMVFDVLDGLVARRAGITSRFGAYLDSLSDAVSFGVAPAFLVKVVVEASPAIGIYGAKALTGLTAIFTLAALFRLARYNVEHTPSEGRRADGRAVATFAGMPTPGAAGVLASLVFLQQEIGSPRLDFLFYAFPILCPVLGYLMVSRLPFVHVGTRFLRGRRDFAYLFLVVVVLVMLIRFPAQGTAAAFVIYMVSGIALAIRRKLKGQPTEESTAEHQTEDIPEGL
jgi:CDP-diacylglycerol--serine O-phosphatidyltransferase